MNRVLACVLLSIGSVLVIYGLNVLPSVVDALARLLAGRPPEQALWFLLAGTVIIAVGIGSFLIAPRGRAAASSRGSGHRQR